MFDRNLLDLRISEEEIVVKSDSIAGKRLSDLNLSEYGCFLNRVVRAQIEMPMDLDIVLAKGDVLQVSGEKSKVKGLADKIGFISVHSQMADLLAFCSFFILGILFGLVTMTFGQVSFSLGNAVGLLLSGITLGFLRANHPTFGYVPQGALNMVKDLGLAIFMVGIGLNAGSKMFQHLSEVGVQVIGLAFLVSVVPVVFAYLVGAYILKMNRALLFGAIIGARTVLRRWMWLMNTLSLPFQHWVMRHLRDCQYLNDLNGYHLYLAQLNWSYPILWIKKGTLRCLLRIVRCLVDHLFASTEILESQSVITQRHFHCATID